MDTGAEDGLSHRRVFDKMKDSYKLEKKKNNNNLQAVSGGKLQVDVCVTFTFKLWVQKLSQQFYVVKGLKRKSV